MIQFRRSFRFFLVWIYFLYLVVQFAKYRNQFKALRIYRVLDDLGSSVQEYNVWTRLWWRRLIPNQAVCCWYPSSLVCGVSLSGDLSRKWDKYDINVWEVKILSTISAPCEPLILRYLPKFRSCTMYPSNSFLKVYSRNIAIFRKLLKKKCF